jgi:AraC-like DNA-binding protein
MSENPSLLSNRPAEPEPELDVLSDVLETMQLRNLIFGRIDLGAPWGIRFLESDSTARFYVVVRGSGLAEIPERSPLSISAGDVLLLPKGGAHILRDAPGSPVIELGLGHCRRHAATGDARRLGGDGAQTILVAGAFQFLGGQRTRLLEDLPAHIHLKGTDPDSAPWLPAIVQLLTAESIARSPGGSLVVSRLADILFVHALRSEQSSSCCGLRGLRNAHVNTAFRLIHGRPGEDWTVERLARAAGLSRSAFAALFHELVGEPPLQYLTRWRMQRAAQELREQNASIAEVAAHVGYQSEASFNKAFKRWEGTTPAAYRRASRAAAQP